jgi:hypothetical protein
MLSLAPSIAVLGLVAFAALRLSLIRTSSEQLAMERATASRVLAITTAIQVGHFAEELATDFHIRFPALFGLEPMPLSFFVAFNLLWILAWVTSVPLLRAGRPIAFFAAWFLALAGMLNGIAHPLMAAVSGGYFPGLVSAPFIGIASVLLWQRLRRATK